MKETLNIYNSFSGSIHGSVHGGRRANGSRKTKRPLSYKRPIQICLKSAKAVGPLSLILPENFSAVQKLIKKQAYRHKVRVALSHNFGNQIQIVVRVQTRESFQNFLRSLSALIVRRITGARKGRPFGKFWDSLAGSVILKSLATAREAFKGLADIYTQMLQGKTAEERMAAQLLLWNSSA